MKFSGQVTAISEPKTGQGTKGEWVSQTIVITEQAEKYPQSIAVEAFNKQDEVSKIQVGCTCDVFFNMEAKEYQGRWFGSNRLWKFENIDGQISTPSF